MIQELYFIYIEHSLISRGICSKQTVAKQSKLARFKWTNGQTHTLSFCQTLNKHLIEWGLSLAMHGKATADSLRYIWWNKIKNVIKQLLWLLLGGKTREAALCLLAMIYRSQCFSGLVETNRNKNPSARPHLQVAFVLLISATSTKRMYHSRRCDKQKCLHLHRRCPTTLQSMRMPYIKKANKEHAMPLPTHTHSKHWLIWQTKSAMPTCSVRRTRTHKTASKQNTKIYSWNIDSPNAKPFIMIMCYWLCSCSRHRISFDPNENCYKLIYNFKCF